MQGPAPFAIASVNIEGWSGEWRNGTPQTLAPDTSPLTMSVLRAGFDATGITTSYADTRTFTRRKRQIYPNQASDTAITVALDDYVYATDTIAGVTNNSTVSSPKPVAAWVMPDRQMVGNSLHWELIAFHRDARNNRQVACVIVTATDGTNTVTQTVASTAVSTLCNDACPVEVFKGDIDITSLNTGLVTLNAKVYPWIGNSASVLDSSTNSTAREFSPRYFLKNVSRLATPPLAYVDGTSGSDTTGTWSTTAATASASPFATVGGALAKIATQSAATGGIADGCRIRVKSAGASLGSSGTNAAQSCAAVVVEPDPAGGGALSWPAAFSAKVGVSGLLTPLTEGAIRFEGVTINRTNSLATIRGESTAKLQIVFFNATVDNGSFNTGWLSNSHDYYFGLTLTSATTSNIGVQTGVEHRLMRGLVCDFGGTAPPEGWVTIGSRITAVKGVGFSDPTKGAIFYANKYLSPWSTTAPIAISTVNAGETVTGFVVVQNLIEVTHTTTGSPALRGPSTDTPSHGNSIHTIYAHNTITGYGALGRCNIFYDNNPGSTEVRTHSLIRDLGNIYVQLNAKGDVNVALIQSDPTNAPLHVGNFPYHHGVGCQGNFTQFRVTSTNLYDDEQCYPGLGSNIGTSVTVRNDPLFTNYQGTGGSGGTPTTGAGGGNYRLQSASPARNIVISAVLSFDLSGLPRPAGKQHAGAYA